MREILYQFNPWWEEGFKVDAIEREKYSNKLLTEVGRKAITFIIGLRRVGKTTLMYKFIEKLLEKISKERILYISLDHPVFDDYSLMDILKEYRTIHGLPRKEKLFLFFDELHMKKGFERELKVLHDLENVKIFASGSSSLLIKHRGAFLTGRYNKILVEPLDFKEFLKFKNITVRPSESYLLDKYLEEYLKTGGMPEYVLKKDSDYILGFVESIIYKDICGVYGIKNPDIIKKLFLLLAERVGKRLTYNKLANIVNLSVDTVRQYTTYLEDTFLVYTITKYAKSLNERIYSPKKVYLADNGIRTVFVGFKDIGTLAENITFLNLKKLGEVCYYLSNGKEVDFVVKDMAVEVKYKDEIEAEDLKAIRSIKQKKKILISKKASSQNDITIVPLKDFLLGF